MVPSVTCNIFSNGFNHKGPKMYNSDGTMTENSSHGSTRLHMDITDALNVMLWAAQQPNGEPGYANWQLFAPRDLDKIRKYLIENGHFKSNGDPIHSQSIYITTQMLHKLNVEYGVVPINIAQQPGMAVFIPGGWAHQVCGKMAQFFHHPSTLTTIKIRVAGVQLLGCYQSCM
jgi:[histone H3]-dimethyl-L-lysine9 demethylase